MDFQAAEDKDGVRLTFNVWPSSRIEATRMVVPIGCCYSPWKAYPGRPVARYYPVTCRSCSAVLNPYCQVDVKVGFVVLFLLVTSLIASARRSCGRAPFA